MAEVEVVERRPLPQSTVQLASQASTDIFGGLSKTPLMLGVVVLNIIGIIAAVYFLNLLIKGQQAHLDKLLSVQQAHLNDLMGHSRSQISEVIGVHNREFDSLVEMIKIMPPAVGSAPAVPPGPMTPRRAQ